MEDKQHLEDLNKETLIKLEAFLKSKKMANKDQNDQIDSAKAKWQAAWNEFLETLLVLERLEI